MTLIGPHGVSFALVAALLFGREHAIGEGVARDGGPRAVGGAPLSGLGERSTPVAVAALLVESARVPRGRPQA